MMPHDGFAATGRLVRLILRLDRIKLTLWLAGLVTLVAITPWSLRAVLDAEAQAEGKTIEAVLVEQATLLETNGASIALQGPPDALDTFGGRYAFEIGAFSLAIIALMNILLIGRHTRAEEESGRAELVRAASVGPWSSLAAVGVIAISVNLVLGVATSLVFIGDGREAGRSLLYGSSVAMCGLLFAAFALVWVQVFEYGRGATGASLAGLAASFALRAVGDVRDDFLSWLSPLGWVQAVNAFGDPVWWPFAVSVATMIASVAAAIALTVRRDVGAGLIGTRPGPDHASATLGTPLGFAWRLQRTVLGWWTVGAAFLGAIYGSVISEIDEFVDENEAFRDMLEAMGMSGDALRDGFITVILSMIALIAMAGVVQSMLRPRGEEVSGRAEPVLAAALSRRAWLGTHAALTALAAPVFMLVAGLTLSVADAAVVGRFIDVDDTLVASIARVPALWAVGGIGLLLYGAARRWSLVIWVVFTVSAIVFLFGELLRLPDPLLNLSPIRHVTHLPGSGQGAIALIVLCAITAASSAVGLMLFERRDLETA